MWEGRIVTENTKEDLDVQVSLKDVQEAMPAESMEETDVLQTLEHRDPTGTSSRHFDKAISVAMLNAKDLQETPEPETVEKDLFAFTRSINKIDYQLQNTQRMDEGVASPPPAEIFRDADQHANTQGDIFAAHAGKLFKRFEKRRPKQALSISTLLTEQQQPNAKGNTKYTHFKKHLYVDSLRDFQEFVESNKDKTWSYIRNTLLFVILPATGVACLLYYVFDNPLVNEESARAVAKILEPDSTPAPAVFRNMTSEAPTIAPRQVIGNSAPTLANTGANGLNKDYPSYSWWIIFLFVRQVITLGLARGTQFLVTQLALNVPGLSLISPIVRVFILQAKGWPMQLYLWATFDLVMLYGDGKFARHWLFYQDFMDVFNDSNPAGKVTSNDTYRAMLLFALFLAAAVAIKRFWIGMRFAYSSYHRYAEKLSKVLKQVVMISKLAQLAHSTQVSKLDGVDLEGLLPEDQEDSANNADGDSKLPSKRQMFSERHVDPGLTDSQQVSIQALLGEWEETDITDKTIEEVSISAIVQFRASISILDNDFPFSIAYGLASTRAQVIDGAQRIYRKLQKRGQQNDLEASDAKTLRFHTLALIALKDNGQMDHKMVKNLMNLFRPNREGALTLLDFCKSVDSLYKELRMLRANISNEARMNAASEKIMNVVFYFIMIMIGLAVVGIDPFALFAFLTSFIVGFAFMIGGASSDYFRGLLFILVQRPYDIGDRISVAGTESESSGNGSAGWVVKDVSLYHTTLIYGTTQEYATLSNGKLSTSRVINAARSPRATLNFVMRFGINVHSATVDEFKTQMVEYIKSKPREWLAFSAFRMTRIEADRAFVEYKIVLQHRESWQQIGALLDSLADAQTFAFDLSKSMGMDYENPSMPISLRMGGPAATDALRNTIAGLQG